VPVRVTIDADTETPISAFLKLSRGRAHAFLFESVEGGERVGRFSFLGAGPREVHAIPLGADVDLLDFLERRLARHRAVRLDGFPALTGGLIGYLSYDAVRRFEPKVAIEGPDESGFPEAVLMDFDTVVAFDHVARSMQVVSQARIDEDTDRGAAYDEAVRRIAGAVRRLSRPLVDRRFAADLGRVTLAPRVPRPAFEAAVARARDFVRAGDCQQIVVSQRFDAEAKIPPFELYRALRQINPSPYLFYVKDGPRALVGSSPETLVRVREGEVVLRPIAGTRRRGATPDEDARLEAELRADPKENAEHVMLVDLGRNDVGRVARVGTVRVDVLKTVERYSHVLHLVSQVRGRLAEGKTCVDAMRSAFPAGTVSGSPKVRAMQIIDELEPARRGPYAGCVGYFDLSGDMEMAIAIRTLMVAGARISVQAGAGVVYDSAPDAEYQETVNKAQALFQAVERVVADAARRAAGPRARGGAR
jgi:anthranilate synthase component 1